jgi:hypothetical protein
MELHTMTEEERRKEAESWNNWKPGSGQKGWPPYTKPIPPSQWRDTEGRPLKADGSLDVDKFIEERGNSR